MFAVSRLNAALRTFATCVAEAGSLAHREEPGFRLPYHIKGDAINGFSLSYGDSPQLANWSRALKMLLTNLKWLHAWSLQRESRDAYGPRRA
jgi:hypothetical protein